MGNDGGSIPGRKDLVRDKPKEIKIDNEIIGKARATLCTLTKQKLHQPIVACRLGFFYNKENILKCLIDKTLPKEFAHIQNLKDIVDVSIQDNSKQNATFQFVCPASLTEFNGLNKFILLWSCGCVFSEKAFIETHDKSQNKCLLCNKPFGKEDIISLNMTSAEQEKIRKGILHERAEKKMKKLAKKKEKQEKSGEFDDEEEKIEKKHKTEVPGIHINMLEKLDDPEYEKIRKIEEKSETYKNLFHKEYKPEGGSLHRNVRHGLR